MTSLRLPACAVLLCLAAFAPAHAQVESSGWQQELDLITAGAGASIVLHFVCVSAEASEEVARWSVQRLQNEVQRLSGQAPADEIWAYAIDAADLKVRALSQSTQGQPCSQLTRLRDIARATAFPLP